MCKVLIAVPTFENISPETFKSIYDLTIPPDVTTDFEFIRGYDCAIARNKIVNKALVGKYDYVFMVDSDIVLPKESLLYMMDPKRPIVIGAYPRKNDPSKSEAFLNLGKNFEDSARVLIADIKENAQSDHRTLIRGSGLGCALIQTDVFRNMSYPYFKYVIYDVQNQFLSEDLYFCVSAGGIGYKILLENRFICGHIKKTIITGNN